MLFFAIATAVISACGPSTHSEQELPEAAPAPIGPSGDAYYKVTVVSSLDSLSISEFLEPDSAKGLDSIPEHRVFLSRHDPMLAIRYDSLWYVWRLEPDWSDGTGYYSYALTGLDFDGKGQHELLVSSRFEGPRSTFGTQWEGYTYLWNLDTGTPYFELDTYMQESDHGRNGDNTYLHECSMNVMATKGAIQVEFGDGTEEDCMLSLDAIGRYELQNGEVIKVE